MEVSDHGQVLGVLGDPAFDVPPVPKVEAPVGIAWLRAHVSRFSTGAEHERRRALAISALSRLAPEALRGDACERAASALGRGESVELVPVETLAAALGLPAGVASDVSLAAAAYQPHAAADVERADGGVRRLVDACGGVADETTAVRISLLVQASAATTALVAGAHRRDDRRAAFGDLLTNTLRGDPPVPSTRRVATAPARIGTTEVVAGTVVTLDLTAGSDAELQFGSGLRPCPGREHALALAAGVLEALRDAR